MPFKDGTGPAGMGPMTGRGMGPCAGNSGIGRMGTGFSRFGSFGRGRGWRNWFRATGLPFWARNPFSSEVEPSREDEMEGLKNDAEFLKNSLKNIEDRMNELSKSK
ncbi:DUF5320 domain-containing protein [candidate division KSB1 bacterium]|nr:DUF5320 domain-containing protein [candidate division KSB1 bacterium]